MGQGSGVVDAVADHGHNLAVGLQVGDDGGFIGRQDVGDDGVDTDLSGDGVGDGLVVAGQQDGRHTQCGEPGDGVCAGGFDRIGDRLDRMGAAVPGDEYGGLSGVFGGGLCLVEVRVIHGDAVFGQQRRTPDGDHTSLDQTAHASTFEVAEVVDLVELSDFGGCTSSDGGRDGVLGGILHRPREGEHVGASGGGGGGDLDECHLARGDRAGFV